MAEPDEDEEPKEEPTLAEGCKKLVGESEDVMKSDITAWLVKFEHAFTSNLGKNEESFEQIEIRMNEEQKVILERFQKNEEEMEVIRKTAHEELMAVKKEQEEKLRIEVERLDKDIEAHAKEIANLWLLKPELERNIARTNEIFPEIRDVEKKVEALKPLIAPLPQMVKDVQEEWYVVRDEVEETQRRVLAKLEDTLQAEKLAIERVEADMAAAVYEIRKEIIDDVGSAVSRLQARTEAMRLTCLEYMEATKSSVHSWHNRNMNWQIRQFREKLKRSKVLEEPLGWSVSSPEFCFCEQWMRLEVLVKENVPGAPIRAPLPGAVSLRLWAPQGMKLVFRLFLGQGESRITSPRYSHTFEPGGKTDSESRACMLMQNMCVLDQVWIRDLDAIDISMEVLEMHFGAGKDGLLVRPPLELPIPDPDLELVWKYNSKGSQVEILESPVEANPVREAERLVTYATTKDEPERLSEFVYEATPAGVNLARNDANRNILSLIAAGGFIEACRVLLAREEFTGVNECDLVGKSALHLAAANDRAAICQEILASGRFTLGVNHEDNSGQTALDVAGAECAAVLEAAGGERRRGEALPEEEEARLLARKQRAADRKKQAEERAEADHARRKAEAADLKEYHKYKKDVYGCELNADLALDGVMFEQHIGGFATMKDSIQSDLLALRNRGVRRIDWRVESCSKLLEYCKPGDSVESPEFSAAGINQLQLFLFPAGRDLGGGGAGPANQQCAVYMNCPTSVSVQGTLAVGNILRRFEHRCGEAGRYGGCPALGVLERQVDMEDCVNVTMELTQVDIDLPEQSGVISLRGQSRSVTAPKIGSPRGASPRGTLPAVVPPAGGGAGDTAVSLGAVKMRHRNPPGSEKEFAQS
eukprot:CAMPEP_0117572906 /NCGR_PEP_ID=MMETSP0784-20121206/60627_1 /TAXON_ID=39447 /ORGANISM="" /LENGTH=874 /DNA_ID=CAMNT_0005371349 /DNA_START=33 /DNA_END=2654 /DNA_ORIENTATION=-